MVLLKYKINCGDLSKLPHLSECLQGQNIDHIFKTEIIGHIENVINEFNRYFPGINTNSVEMKMTRDPFNNVTVDEIPDVIQSEFIDLKNDSFFRDKFHTLSIFDFWAQAYFIYENVSKAALKILLPFTSTYLCESAFSSYLYIKNKYRSRLDASHDCRLAISNKKPNITKLVEILEASKSSCFFYEKTLI